MALYLKKYLKYSVHHCQLFQIILEVTTLYVVKKLAMLSFYSLYGSLRLLNVKTHGHNEVVWMSVVT